MQFNKHKQKKKNEPNPFLQLRMVMPSWEYIRSVSRCFVHGLEFRIFLFLKRVDTKATKTSLPYYLIRSWKKMNSFLSKKHFCDGVLNRLGRNLTTAC